LRGENGEWGVEMTAQSTKLEAAENDLKQLMADVTRAIEKARVAIERISGKVTAATPGTDATTSSP
jgi:hypothetical protein